MVISVVFPAISGNLTPGLGVGLIVAANSRATKSATGCRDNIDTYLLTRFSPRWVPLVVDMSAEWRPLIDPARRHARAPPHPRDPVGVLVGDKVAHHSHRDVHQERRPHGDGARRRKEPRERQQ